MEEKKKMERHDEKGRLAMAGNNYGDHNKIEAQVTRLLGNSPAAKRTEFSTAPLFWGISKPSKLAGDGGVLVPLYPSPVT